MPLATSQTLPEKEARAIASQICAGLAYINSPPHRIIHYDLKPANVLFDQHGEVKLTVSMSSCACSPMPEASVANATCRDVCIERGACADVSGLTLVRAS